MLRSLSLVPSVILESSVRSNDSSLLFLFPASATATFSFSGVWLLSDSVSLLSGSTSTLFVVESLFSGSSSSVSVAFTSLMSSSWLSVTFGFFRVFIVVDIIISVFVFVFLVVIHPELFAGFWYGVVIVERVSTLGLFRLFVPFTQSHSYGLVSPGFFKMAAVDVQSEFVKFHRFFSLLPRSLLVLVIHVGWWSDGQSLVRISGSRGRYFRLFFTLLSELCKVRLSCAVAFVVSCNDMNTSFLPAIWGWHKAVHYEAVLSRKQHTFCQHHIHQILGWWLL